MKLDCPMGIQHWLEIFMISIPKMDKKVGLNRGYSLFTCCIVRVVMLFTMILEGFYYHVMIITIEKNHV